MTDDGYAIHGHDWPAPQPRMTGAEAEAALGRITPAHVEQAREELRADRPSRFSATPAEIDAFLAKHFAEDVRLRHQQAIGAAAAIEAAEDVRGDSGHIRYGSGVDYAERHATLIDPRKDGGPYPSTLIDLNSEKATT